MMKTITKKKEIQIFYTESRILRNDPKTEHPSCPPMFVHCVVGCVGFMFAFILQQLPRPPKRNKKKQQVQQLEYI